MALNPKLLLVTIYFCLLVNKQMMVVSKPAIGNIVVNNEININIEGENDNAIDLSNVVIGENNAPFRQSDPCSCENCSNKTSKDCSRTSQNRKNTSAQQQGKMV